MRTFTAAELAAFDGTDDQPAYVAYNGVVYDVSAGPTWAEGMHFEHLAGRDLTEALEGAPHDDEVFEGMPVVGHLAE